MTSLTLCIHLLLTMHCAGNPTKQTIQSNLMALLLANNQEMMSVCVVYFVIPLIMVQCCWMELESLAAQIPITN